MYFVQAQFLNILAAKFLDENLFISTQYYFPLFHRSVFYCTIPVYPTWIVLFWVFPEAVVLAFICDPGLCGDPGEKLYAVLFVLMCMHLHSDTV